MRVLSKPTVKEFKLTTDPDGEARVVIRQATFDQSRRRGEMFAKRRTVVRDDFDGEYAIEQEWNSWEIIMREIYLTMVGASGFYDEDGEDLFKFRPDHGGLAMSESQFERAVGLLPEDVITEIHDFVVEMNPQWGAKRGE